ncbi:MAG: hypothetical protein SF053_22525, partial [Bacteroidia bacterium]|nr:hypothetical protein [Bacteroidia bacterium]
VSFKNGLAISYEKLGSTHSNLGNLPQALNLFEQYNQLSKELHEAYPENVDFQANFAESLAVLFALKKCMGLAAEPSDLDRALRLFEELHSQVQTPHYQRKVTLCEQMYTPDVDLLRLISEMSSF